MKEGDSGYDGFGEAYFSTVPQGMVKGWKRHRKMTLNLVVPFGRIRFVICDDRGNSNEAPQFLSVVLSPETEETYQRLTVRPELWVAFRGEAPGVNLALNLANLRHDPHEAEDRPLECFAWQWP
jgi:dTDP-4-dehydrorhamnose 3,5-epimerase